MKKNLLKKLPMLIVTLQVIIPIFLLLLYKEVHSLKSEFTKEGLFKLCFEGKIGTYSYVNDGVR